MNTANTVFFKQKLKIVLIYRMCFTRSSMGLPLDNTLSSELLVADILKDLHFTDINVTKSYEKYSSTRFLLYIIISTKILNY
jgi:hypothetical protein